MCRLQRASFIYHAVHREKVRQVLNLVCPWTGRSGGFNGEVRRDSGLLVFVVATCIVVFFISRRVEIMGHQLIYSSGNPNSSSSFNKIQKSRSRTSIKDEGVLTLSWHGGKDSDIWRTSGASRLSIGALERVQTSCGSLRVLCTAVVCRLASRATKTHWNHLGHALSHHITLSVKGLFESEKKEKHFSGNDSEQEAHVLPRPAPKFQ